MKQEIQFLRWRLRSHLRCDSSDVCLLIIALVFEVSFIPQSTFGSEHMSNSFKKVNKISANFALL